MPAQTSKRAFGPIWPRSARKSGHPQTWRRASCGACRNQMPPGRGPAWSVRCCWPPPWCSSPRVWRSASPDFGRPRQARSGRAHRLVRRRHRLHRRSRHHDRRPRRSMPTWWRPASRVPNANLGLTTADPPRPAPAMTASRRSVHRTRLWERTRATSTAAGLAQGAGFTSITTPAAGTMSMFAVRRRPVYSPGSGWTTP